MAVRKGGLGKGLDALFIDNTTDNGAVTLRISEIEPNAASPERNLTSPLWQIWQIPFGNTASSSHCWCVRCLPAATSW